MCYSNPDLLKGHPAEGIKYLPQFGNAFAKAKVASPVTPSGAPTPAAAAVNDPIKSVTRRRQGLQIGSSSGGSGLNIPL
jgi:hypothetical protein